MRDQLIRGEFLAGFRLLVEALALFRFPLRRCGIHCNHEILARLKACRLDRFENLFDCFFIRSQLIRCKTAFITDSCDITHILDELFQRMEHLCTPAKCFLEGRCADRHNHEFLRINSTVSVCAAVQNIHHRNRQFCTLNAAEETIKRDAERSRSGPCGGNRHGKNRICAELGFILCSVSFDHRLVDGINVRSIHAGQHLIDCGIDVFDSFLYTLPEIAGFVAVAQFQCLKFAGRCAAGSSSPADRTVHEENLRLDGRIAAGIHNLTTNDLFNLQVFHKQNLLFRRKYGIIMIHMNAHDIPVCRLIRTKSSHFFPP